MLRYKIGIRQFLKGFVDENASKDSNLDAWSAAANKELTF